MNKKEAIEQLESFISDCKEFVSVEPTEKDVQALEIAIAALKETAPEVPVQDQLIKKLIDNQIFELEKKRYKELKLFYFMNMLMFVCLALNSIVALIQN